MGLMNIGKKEGSQIIQLFGRGVRLKGYDFCLKRSRAIEGRELEKKFQSVETLNIFGLKADYMKAFKDYLKDEGVPTDERVEFVLPVLYDKTYKSKKLKVLDLQVGKDFKKEVKLDFEYVSTSAIHRKVILSLYKQVDILESQNRSGRKLELNSEILQKEHLSFVNIDTLFFALQQFKNEKNWSNLNISKKSIANLLNRSDWYKLFIPRDDMKVSSFKNLSNFETIMITLLKKYMKSFYEYKKSEWESQFLEYRELDEEKDKANLINEYIITIEDKEIELIEKLKTLKSMLESGAIDDAELHKLSNKGFKTFSFDRHLYNPLIFKDKYHTALQIKPVELNDGEKDFVEDLSSYLKRNEAEYEDTEIYLLRNQSKTGIGLFTEGNFYPDFIMWINKNSRQYISFIDPKGLVNLNTKDDPKINLSSKIKEIETKLDDEAVILNSFIVSITPYGVIKWVQDTLEKHELENKNVLFQKDDKNTYIGKMFDRILN